MQRLVFMEVTATTTRQLTSRASLTDSTSSPRVLRRQTAIDERSITATADTHIMERRRSIVDYSASSGYFPSKQSRRESEDTIGRKTSVDHGPGSGRKASVVEQMDRRKSSTSDQPSSVSMYFKRSPTTTRRDSGEFGSGRKSSMDTSRRMSVEPSDRRKGSTETSVSSYFKRSPIQARRESDDLITRKSSVDNSRKTSVDTACTVIYRPATITEDSNVAIKTENGEICEHDVDTADSNNEKDTPRGGRGQREEKGASRHQDQAERGERDREREITRTEDRETDTELDRRFMMSEGRDGRTRRSHEFGDRLTVRDAKRKVSGTSRSSMSSIDSDAYNTVVKMPKRWTMLETVGRCMLLFSVAFFIVGVLITVFGFSNTGIDKSQQIPLQVLGPTCLTMTVVMWVVWYVITRLGSLEWKRTQQAIELRDRVQLHAMAMDILKYPVITPGMLQNPDFRRQLMMKMRHKVMDLGSEYSESRRSSRACSEASKRRYSSVQYEKLLQPDLERKRSRTSVDGKPPFELPGIHISRIETLDFGSDGRASICSRSTRSRGSSYILIPSDMASDFSRLSCPSDYSLAGSRSSRSRGSRASSNLSSRMWDFSPRESDWDADISLGSRESQLSVLRQDWGGGPMDSTDCLSPHMPHRLSVVTFNMDMSSPTLRRHSSPVCPTRRKDSHTECTCGRGEYPSMRNRDMSCHSLRFSDGVRIVESTAARKRSADLVSCRSLRIEEDEREALHESMYHSKSPQTASTSTQAEASVSTTTTTSSDPAVASAGSGSQKTERFRPPFKRNNTDDSEVERRVARLFKEIEYSVSESVDDSKIHSFSSDFDYFGKQKVEAKEAQTQTMSETEIKMYETGEYDMSYDGSSSGRATKTESWNESLGRESHDSHSSEQTCEEGGKGASRSNTTKKKKSRSFEKTLSTISNALSSLGRRNTNNSDKDREHPRHPAQRKPIPTSIVTQGLSVDRDDGNEQEHPIKSPPPTYEDVVNKNL